MSHGSAHLQSQNSPPGLPISRPTSFPYAVKPLPFIRPSPDGEGVLSLGTSYDLIRSNGGKWNFSWTCDLEPHGQECLPRVCKTEDLHQVT